MPSTTINAGGTLSPGNSIGTINDRRQSDLRGRRQLLSVEVSPTSADRTNVTGTATLAGTLQRRVGTGGYTGNTYTILSGSAALTGTFGTATRGMPATTRRNLGYTSTDVC